MVYLIENSIVENIQCFYKGLLALYFKKIFIILFAWVLSFKNISNNNIVIIITV